MRNVTLTSIFLFLLVVSFAAGHSAAADYKVSLAQMPVYAESLEKGVLVDFTKAIAQESGKAFDVVVVPFARSINNVVTKQADFHMPLIAVPDIDMATLEYDYSTETIFHVNFVLYTKKESGITIDKLPDARVETDIAHVAYFDFKITGSSNIEQSLLKLNAGRIDAFIFADFATDPLVKKNNLTQIQRDLYKVYDVKIILPKGGLGGPTDQFLSETIGKLREKGIYDSIMGVIDTPYDNWQP